MRNLNVNNRIPSAAHAIADTHPSVGTAARTLMLYLWLSLSTIITSGCVTITPASEHRELTIVMPEPLPEAAWPTRYPEPIDAIISAARQAEEDGHTGSARADFIGRVLGQNQETVAHRVLGRGIVCEMPAQAGSDDLHLIYITNRIPEQDFELLMEYVRPTRIEREELLKWYFRLQSPPAGVELRGLVLHLTSIGDPYYERTVSNRLVQRGWAVLHVEPGRFNIPMLHDDQSHSFGQVITPEKIAANLDHYAADYAYAVEGVLAYLEEVRHEIPQMPFVITGYSAGSLALPTIAALLGDKVNAAVFIGGGANVVGILIDSRLTGLEQRARRNIASEHMADLRNLPDGYLAVSQFDPYHMAPYLADKPVLMLHAHFDEIVPRKYGDLLYERLGQPERWTYPIGHIFLFQSLPTQAERIAQWIETATHREKVAAKSR